MKEEQLTELGLISLEKRRLRDNLMVLDSYPREHGSEMWGGLFSKITSDRMGGNGLKLLKGRFGIRKSVFIGRFTKHWNRLLRAEVESLSLKVFKRCADVAFRDMV